MTTRAKLTLLLVLLAGATRSPLAFAHLLDDEPKVEQLPADAAKQPVVTDDPDRPRPLPIPEVDEAVTQLLEQPYLSDEELADLRVKHGIWTSDDIKLGDDSSAAQVRRAAHAALMRGDLLHASLSHKLVPAPLRAAALIEQGEPAQALDVVKAETVTPQVRLLRARALLDLGKAGEARTLLQEAEDIIASGARDGSAADIAALVRSCVLLARLQPAPVKGEVATPKVSFQQLLDALAFARDNIDRLDPEPYMAEVLLLLEKNNYAEASEAMQQAVALSPRSTEAWRVAGELAAQTFDFPRARRVAATLDAIAQENATADAEAEDDSDTPPPSLAGTIVRTTIALREIEGQQAIEELSPALTLYPTQRRLLALRAAAHAVAFDDASMKAALEVLDDLAPGTPEGYLAAGDVLALARQYADAANVLQEASKRAPGWAEPAVELGLSELQAGNLAAARAALEHAEALDRSNVRANNSLVLLRELDAYTTIENDNFIVRYKPGSDELLAKEMLPQLDKIFARVTGDKPGGIRFRPPQKTVIELYPNHRWFSTRITGMPALHTFAAATGPVIAMEAPRSGPGHLVGPYDWPRVVQHEYVHTVTLARTKNRLPHWFTEASAVYLEDAPMDWNTVQMLTGVIKRGGLFDFDTINIKFIRPRKPIERSQAYMQGAWMYAYMIERFGEETPLKLMDLYAQGVREEKAFGTVLGVTRAEFLQAFEEHATATLQKWGMLESDTVPSIDSLLEQAKETEPTKQLVAKWLEDSPKHPLVLDLAVKFMLQESKGKARVQDIELLERHAAARPMDPTAHRLLAQLYLDETLASELAAVSKTSLDAIPHLEFLDVREQNSTAYAAELAKLYARKAAVPGESAAQAHWAKALEKAKRATQLSPYDATVRELAATIALRAGDIPAARAAIEALIVIEPTREIHRQRLEVIKQRKQ
jgi:tetratricopeptide (TPR) repeat protein